MNASQLWETTMNKDTRRMTCVTVENAAVAERRLKELMGKNPELRKEWIQNNVNFEDVDELVENNEQE